jgi:hypothetical protein
MSKLRDSIGKIYGVHLDDTYDLGTYFKHLGITGVIDQKRMNETVYFLIKELQLQAGKGAPLFGGTRSTHT